MSKEKNNNSVFVFFVLGLLIGINIIMICDTNLNPITSDEYTVYKIGVWRTSIGHSFPYIMGDFESFKQALQKAIWDLNETSGGFVYSDPDDNSIYHIK